jgi:NitT/TauT family transport system substrate-binding protein
MLPSFFSKYSRRAATTLLTSLLLGLTSMANADEPYKMKFTLDWRFEGPSAPFLLAKAKGYFAAEGLDVTVDSGSGSVGAVTRVASGAYEMGFADFNALAEYDAQNPGSKIKGVYMVYNFTPAAVVTLKKSNITKPGDLVGKTLAAPIFDAGRKAFPAFAKSNKLDPASVKWQSVDPALRETMLARGEVDAITGFSFTSVLSLEARGVKENELNVMLYNDYGVELYGNAIIASPKFMAEKPELVKGFLRAFNKALKETIANPDAAAAYVKAADALADLPLETRRLKMAMSAVVVTPEARANGLGAVTDDRLQRSLAETAAAYNLKSVPSAKDLFTSNFLPAKADRMIK